MSQQWREYLQPDFFDELIGPDGPRPAARPLLDLLSKLGPETLRERQRAAELEELGETWNRVFMYRIWPT